MNPLHQPMCGTAIVEAGEARLGRRSANLSLISTDGMTARVLTRKCNMCEEASVVDVTFAGFMAYMNGTLVQDAFPTMPKSQRELLITGTHDACWAALFADDGEDEEDAS